MRVIEVPARPTQIAPEECLAAIHAAGPVDVAPGLWHEVVDVLESFQPLAVPNSPLHNAP
jgi:hypothetical protein